MEVLLILLEQRGQLVSREQIVERIWSKDVFLDTDNGINGAIRKIRQVLRDDPEQPRFVQTITGKGYRFIAPVVEPVSENHGAQEPMTPLPPQGLTAVALVAIPQGLVADVRAAAEKPSKRRGVLVAGLALAGVLLLAGGYWGWRHFGSRAAPTPSITRLAVLPLENLSGDPGQEYFADGMTDELITDLAKISSLQVISRTSVMRYKGTRKPLAEIARELGVDAVVEGSVTNAGEKVRITAKLIEVRTDRHLWADDYEENLTDILSVQNKVARDIAESVRARLTQRERTLLTHAPPVSPEAYEYYLRGLFFHNLDTPEGFHRAIESYQKAISLSPSYAPAHSGLAESYFELASFWEAPPREFVPRAEAEALEALREDPAVPEARCLLAYARASYEWKWAEAESEFKRGLELSPNSSKSHTLYAFYLVALGRFEDAIAEQTRARALDPLSLVMNQSLAEIFCYARRYDRAVEQYRRTLEMFPKFALAHVGLARTYLAKGMLAEAAAETEASADSPKAAAAMAQAFAASGYPGVLKWQLEDLHREARHKYVSPLVFAWQYAALNDKDHAIQWLERAYAEHSTSLFFINVFPGFDALHTDPRYQDLMRRLGLPQ